MEQNDKTSPASTVVAMASASQPGKEYLGDYQTVWGILRNLAASAIDLRMTAADAENPSAAMTEGITALVTKPADIFLGKDDQFSTVGAFNHPGAIDEFIAVSLGIQESTPEDTVKAALVMLVVSVYDAIDSGIKEGTDSKTEIQAELQRFTNLMLGIPPTAAEGEEPPASPALDVDVIANGGPGSGCKGDNCGRKKKHGVASVKAVLGKKMEEWFTDYKPDASVETDEDTMLDKDTVSKWLKTKPAPKWKSAGAVIHNDKGEIALIAPKNKYGGYEYTFPKGRIEGDEKPEDAAHREVGEESGLKGELGESLGEHEGTNSHTTYFMMKHTGGGLKQDGETSEVKWVKPEEAADLLDSVRDLRVLVKAMTAMKNQSTKSADSKKASNRYEELVAVITNRPVATPSIGETAYGILREIRKGLVVSNRKRQIQSEILCGILPKRIENRFAIPDDGFIHIVPKGVFPHKTGLVQVVDDAALDKIVESFNKDKASPNFAGVLTDYDHFSQDSDKESEAAGWITELDRRPDGIWGRVDWSTSGQNAVTGGEYRFTSPVWLRDECEDLDGNRIRPTRLDTVALTNDPNMKGMVPVSKPVA